MTVADILSKHGIKLGNVAPGRHYTTCPHCSAGRSSSEHRGAKVLGITIGADGKVHFGCNHCGWTGPEKGRGDRSNGKERDDLPAYVYRDADGVPRFRKVRNLPGREPRFWLERADGRGGWIKGTKGVDTKLIYRADQVKKATAEGRIIACAEGEKDADSLWLLGIAATCNAHGASEPGKQAKWTKAHSEQLAGADIVVFNDNDAAGYKHAAATCTQSLGIARRVRRLDLGNHWPEIPKGGDVSDWLSAGHTREELVALIETAPDYAASAEQPQAELSEQGADGTDAEIERLAKLSTIQYEQERKGAASQLGVRAPILDRLVQAERERLGLVDDDGRQGRSISLPEPEPWPTPIDGVALLDGIAEAIGRYVVMSEHARHAAALWVAHTYLLDCFSITPRLAVRSPMKRCGKTTLLDVLSRLVLRPLPTGSVTAAALFRVVEGYRPTLLVDEADTFLSEADELRGTLNSGHRKGGQVVRTVGDDHEPRAFSTFAAVTIAIIGNLPDTLADRSVTVDLKRRMPSEKVASFRFDRVGHLDVLARQAARWAQDHAGTISAADPEMPGIHNREADNWAPLLAIADAAGGAWPERARAAAAAGHVAGGDEASLIELLLGDIRDAFAKREANKVEPADRISSGDLVTALVAIEGRPWAELGKSRKPLTQNGLARRLRPLSIAPDSVRVDEKRTPKGYYLHQFKEAFARYLGTEEGSKPQQRNNFDETGTSESFQSATPEPVVAVGKCEKSASDGPCCGAEDEKGDVGGSMHVGDGNGLAPGLSQRTITELAEAYAEAAYSQNQEGTDIDSRTLDADLRRRLAEMVLPEFVETEFTRVMEQVFRV
jgi:putative DNA primase/helicase